MNLYAMLKARAEENKPIRCGLIGAGKYSALWRPYHLIGLELGVSVASVALRAEPTASPHDFSADGARR